MDPHAHPATGSLEERLPLLVRHAELLWWLLAAVSVAVGIVLVRAAAGWVGALRARWIRRALGTVETDLRDVAGREVTLAGTLTSGAEPHELEPEGTVAASHLGGVGSPGQRWMLSDQAMVEIAEPFSVLVGSQEESFAERTLRVGDRIVARGRVERSPLTVSGPHGFRVGAAALRLLPRAGCPLPIAFEGRPKRTGGRRFDAFVGGALGVVLWLWGSAMVSEAAVISARSSEGPLSSVEMIGASAPARRESALRNLAPDRTATEARHASYADFETAQSGDCEQTRHALMGAGRVALVAELAPRCTSAKAIRDAARALMTLGRFEEAHQRVLQAPACELDRPTDDAVRLDVEAHVLSGHFADAALAIKEVDLRASPWSFSERAPWWCIEGALEVLAGRTDEGLAVLRGGHHGPAEAACAVLLADATEGKGRLDALESVRRHRGWARVTSALSLEVDATQAQPREMWTPVYAHLVFGEPLHAPVHFGWLRGAHQALSSHPAPTPVMHLERASLAAELAFYSAAIGDAEEARGFSEDARSARELAAADSLLALMWIRDEDASRLALLSGAVAARTGDYSEARRWIARASSDSSEEARQAEELGRLVDQLEHGESEPAHDFLPAGLDDGRALTRWLEDREERVTERTLLLGAGRLVLGREALGSAMARGLGRNPTSLLSPLRLVDLAAHWHNRALVARTLGEGEATRTYAARAERFRAVLRRRDVALLLEVLSSI